MALPIISSVPERLWFWRHGRSTGWQLIADRALAYRAPNGFDGVCHLRVFESTARRRRPIVIVGELSDQAGACSITNACEYIAAEVQETFFGSGRRFDYVEHHPETINGAPEPTFALVHLKRARTRGKGSRGGASSHASVKQEQVVVVTEEGSEDHPLPRASAGPAGDWAFTTLRREPFTAHPLGAGRVELDILPDVEVRVWPVGDYTAYAVAGEEGVLPMARAAEDNSERAAKLIEAIDAVTEASPDEIVDVSTDTDPDRSPPTP